jgi:ankyrin repeat protein
VIPSIDEFFAAIEAGDLPLVRSFLERDPSFANAIDNRLRARFEESGVERQRQVGSGLVGEPPKPLPPRGDTALHIAVQHNQLKIVRLLVAYGANVNAVNERQVAMLHVASTRNDFNLDLIRFLIESGADVNAAGSRVSTPLAQAAALQGDPLPLIEFLLEKGADANAASQNGRTPLGSIVLRLGYPWDRDYVPVIEALLRYGANVNPVREKNGDTLLSIVAFQGCVRVARLLIAAGADPNSSWRSGSALHAAAVHGSPELIELFLEAGADPMTLDEDGKTPLDLTKPYEETLERIEQFLNERQRGEP